VQGELALTVDESTYRIWLAPLRPVELCGELLVVEAPPQTCDWIHDRFGRLLEASIELILGPHAAVQIVAGTTAKRSTSGASAPHPATAPPGAPARVGEASPVARSGDLDPSTVSVPLANPKLTFDQFVIGDSNRLAHAAALAVAEMPAQAYNPLFICGPPGVGKTHLLSAISSLLLSHSPGLTVRCTTGEAFTNEFLGALAGKHTELFKARFRHIDVLLIDDVQFLERKTRTEEEFFHTFNALHDGGRQIVVTSDRPPSDLQALEDRLRERFEAGLVADIRPPDRTTRLAILRKRVQHDDVPLAEDGALDVIAERIDSNVRALEGALIRVVAFSSLTGRPLDSALAGEVLDSLYPQSCRADAGRPRSIADIQAAACEHFGLSREELLSSARTSRIAWPRQVAMYLARQLTGESLPAIGRQFGGRDHTTVMHACRRTSQRIDADATAREAVENLFKRLRSS
jgi:chromosomal replication initiator protein